MVIAGTFGNLKNWPQKTGSRAVQLAAERINSASTTETARKNCYSSASRRRKVMLPLGVRAENRALKSRKSLHFLWLIIFTCINSFSNFCWAYWIYGCKAESSKRNIVMLSELRLALFFPVKKDSVGKGTLASVLLSENSWCCVLEKEKKKKGKRNHTKHASHLNPFGLQCLKHEIWVLEIWSFNCIDSDTQVGAIKKFPYQWF